MSIYIAHRHKNLWCTSKWCWGSWTVATSVRCGLVKPWEV